VQLTTPLSDAPAAAAALRWSPGVCHWKVPHPDFTSGGQLFSTVEEAPEELLASLQLQRSMFAPSSSAVSPPLCLERCMRLLPTHSDGGGFFCAVMTKATTDRQVSSAICTQSALRLHLLYTLQPTRAEESPKHPPRATSLISRPHQPRLP
jgi:hypothetical protein